MRRLRVTLCASALSLALGGGALADPLKPELVWNAGVASNYMYRGVSQTAGGVEGFGGADLTYGPVYAGVWASNVDFQGDSGNGDTTNIETDIYGGLSPTFAGATFTLGGVYYAYWSTPKAVSGTNDYFELKAGISKVFGPVTAGVQYFHSWKFPQNGGPADYFEGDLAYAISPKLSLSGALARQTLDINGAGLGVVTGYNTWNLGLTYAITDHFSIDGRYSGVNSAAADFFGRSQSGPFNAGNRVFGTLKATFP